MKKNLWVKLGAGLAALSLLSACGGGAKADGNEDSGNHGEDKIKSAGVLKVGTEAQYAPYEFKDADAKIVGADIALAQKIADDLGVKLEIVDMKFDGIIPAVQSGQVDMGIAAFSNTPERAKEVDFSNIYDKSEQMLVVDAQNKDKYTSVDALSGLKVGAQKGTIQSNLITKELTKSTLFELDKFPALALEVQNGNIAGLVADASVAKSLISGSCGKLAAANFTFTSEAAKVGKAVVIKKGNSGLVDAVNKSVDAFVSDGSWDKAYAQAVKQAKSLGLGQ
jgi:polar amino acid uptake ABC transporter, PAAT family, amino acid-binding protein